MIFGEKLSFAVEFFPGSTKVYTKVHIWVNESCLGTDQDESFAKSLLYSLRRMQKPTEVEGLDNESVLVLLSSKPCEDQFLVNLGDCFDDFLIRSCSCHGTNYLWWENATEQFFPHRNLVSSDFVAICNTEWDGVLDSGIKYLQKYIDNVAE